MHLSEYRVHFLTISRRALELIIRFCYQGHIVARKHIARYWHQASACPSLKKDIFGYPAPWR